MAVETRKIQTKTGCHVLTDDSSRCLSSISPLSSHNFLLFFNRQKVNIRNKTKKWHSFLKRSFDREKKKTLGIVFLTRRRNNRRCGEEEDATGIVNEVNMHGDHLWMSRRSRKQDAYSQKRPKKNALYLIILQSQISLKLFFNFRFLLPFLQK